MSLQQQLQRGLAELSIELDADRQQQLIQYLELISKWNRHFNLTAIRDINEMLPLHVLDSLTVLPYLRGEKVLDVGTGAGLPGIPLAISRPELHVTLLDSNGKKTRFLTQVKIELGLNNVDVVKERIEDYRPEHKFDVIVSRAFASLTDMINAVKHLITSETRVLAMKADAEQELATCPVGFEPIAIHELTIPGLMVKRQLIEIQQSTE